MPAQLRAVTLRNIGYYPYKQFSCDDAHHKSGHQQNRNIIIQKYAGQISCQNQLANIMKDRSDHAERDVMKRVFAQKIHKHNRRHRKDAAA